MRLQMSVYGEIKIAAKTARKERSAEAAADRSSDLTQKTIEVSEFASRQFRRGTILVGILAVEEGARVEFGGDNLAMAAVASGLGILAMLADRRAAEGMPAEQELRPAPEPLEIVQPPPAFSPAA